MNIPGSIILRDPDYANDDTDVLDMNRWCMVTGQGSTRVFYFSRVK